VVVRYVVCGLLLSFLIFFDGRSIFAQRVRGPVRVEESRVARMKKPAPRLARSDSQKRRTPVRVEERGKEKRSTHPGVEVRGGKRTRGTIPIIEGESGSQGEVERRAPSRASEGQIHGKTPVRRLGNADREDEVRSTLERFRQNWIKGDSGSLMRILPDRSQVKITIESKGISDSFGKGQAQYVLKEYLSSSKERQLSFSRLRVSSSDGVSAYGVGKMRMQDRKTGRMLEHTVYISMKREGDKWTVREIHIMD